MELHMTDSKHYLNSVWILWYHNPSDSNWDLDSYHKVYTIKTIENFWEMMYLIKASYIQSGMFFLMKENIKPMWEDKYNVDGGCWSFRISKKDVTKIWQELAMAVLGEFMTQDTKYATTINGLSISPKRSFSIVKIWNNNVTINGTNVLNAVPGLNMDEIIYKPHVESIDKDREKRLNKQKNELEMTSTSPE